MTSPEERAPNPPPQPHKHDKHFRTDHLTGSIARRSARGGVVTVAAQAARLGLQLASTAVLARLLTPADFGLYAMVAVFSGFIARFRDLGLAAATVQRAEVSHAQVSTLYWISVVVGAVIMLLTAAISPFVAWFFDEEALVEITIALSVAFLISGFGAQQVAIMQRQMRFKTLAAVQVAAMSCGIAAAIVVALAGGRTWALVAQALVQSLTDMLLSNLLSGWRPGRPRMSPDVREMLRFGGTLTIANMANFLSRNFDNLVIGKFAGAAPLGIYSKAYGLLLVPVQQVNGPIAAVAIPALARLQDRPAEYRRYYLRMVQLIAYISMPLAVLLIALSDEVVLILLGPQWHEAATIFRIFSLFLVIQNVVQTTGWVLQSLGRVSRYLKWQLSHAAIFVVACVVGVQWGAIGVAIATTVQALLAVLPGMWVAYRDSPVTVRDVLGVIVKPALLAALIMAGAATAHFYVDAQPLLIRVAEVLAAGAFIAVIAVLAIGSIRRDLIGLASSLRGAILSRKKSAQA
jgi:PST family polysaccharide transporter